MFDIGFPRDWSSLKKLIWLKAAISGGGASAVWKTVTGALIHITNALASPMRKCEVTLEPIQDLHGQDAPYPAGGGKNLVDQPAILAKGATIESDGSYHVNLSSSLAETIVFQNDGTEGQFAITFISKNTSTGRGVYPQIKYTDGTIEYLAVTGHASYETVTKVTQGTKIVDFVGLTYGNNVATWFYIQVEKGSTPTSWSPYENICPITGWTGCEVTRTGKNLYNPNAVTDNSYLSTTTGLPEAQVGYVVSDYIPVIKNQGVIIPASGTARRWFYDKNKNPVTYLNNSSNQLFTPSDDGFIRVSVSKTSIFYNTYIIAYGSGSVPSEGLPTEYEPYNGTTLSVTFPDSAGTVYGGTVDLVSGVLTVLWKSVEAQTLTWVARTGSMETTISDRKYGTYIYPLSSHYKGDWLTGWAGLTDEMIGAVSNYIVIRIKDDAHQASLADWNNYLTAQKTAGTPVQILYELATPIEIQLTPQQISTLKGENNVWGDGNIEMTYKAQAE